MGDERRLRRCTGVAVLLAAMLAGSGCAPEEPLRVGAKSFVEQEVLAEMTAALVGEAGMAVDPIASCGDTYECHHALREGEIDLLVEYTGTGFLILGEPIETEAEPLQRLRALYEPQGLAWTEPLGFDNGYRIVMRTDRALALEIASIGDLAALGPGLRIACPPEYLRRPVDGHAALLRRYGLRTRDGVVLLHSPVERFHAVLDGVVDVALTYGTDGFMADPRLIALDDPLGFFPRYEAAFLVRADTLERMPALEGVLAPLQGTIDEGAMREMNYAVQVEGRRPAAVAREFLRSRGLLADSEDGLVDEPRLLVAVHEHDELHAFVPRAMDAVRAAYPERAAELRSLPRPVDAVAGGQARLGIVGSERFFSAGGDTVAAREERIEAVAVLGVRMVHVVRRADDGGDALQGRVGVPEAASGGARVGEVLLGATEPAARGPADELLDQVRGGTLDAAVLLAPEGDPGIARAVGEGGLRLVSLEALGADLRSRHAPYLRPSRVAAGTYPGQGTAVETLSAQVVLAGPSRGSVTGPAGGPASALPVEGRSIPRATVEALAAATGVPEAPDPVLPSAWAEVPTGAGDEGPGSPVVDKVANGLVIAFLLSLVWLVVRREPRGGARA